MLYEVITPPLPAHDPLPPHDEPAAAHNDETDEDIPPPPRHRRAPREMSAPEPEPETRPEPESKPDPAVGALEQRATGIERIIGSGDEDRITSYNVCYTKLLRPP